MSAVLHEEPERPDQSSMLAVIAKAASDPAVDIGKLERLIAMKERMDARQAETDFNAAMNRAQARIRPIAADATNPQTRSNYATYAALDKALRPIYTDEGFALSFDTGEGAPEGCARVLCYVSHASGHTRTYRADMPADGKGAKGGDVMTKTHAMGAAMSYGSRYLLKLVFNVAIGEDDTDGNAPQDKDQSWLDALEGCGDEAAVNKLKAELIAKVGGTDKVSARLKAAFVAKLKAVKA